jgi:hypothetical protein
VFLISFTTLYRNAPSFTANAISKENQCMFAVTSAIFQKKVGTTLLDQFTFLKDLDYIYIATIILEERNFWLNNPSVAQELPILNSNFEKLIN